MLPRGAAIVSMQSLPELMPASSTIASISVATIQGQLPAPVVFGDWIMTQREFVVVRIRADSGHEGWAFTLTRDGAVAEQIRRTLVPVYIGSEVGNRERTFRTAWRRSLASHCAGVGLRALSIVDLAMWDLAAKIADRSVAELLGGAAQPMPATAIIGYPPGKMGPEETAAQVKELSAAGWKRFKAPIAATPELSAARLRAARAAAGPDAWLGCDGAWVFDDVAKAVAFAHSIADVKLGWFEDVFPPGDALQLAELRRQVDMPIAMGDEQGGSYYPQALIQADAVDVVRIDLTCMGGITGGRRIVDECLRANVAFSPHMFAHVHSQVFSGWGFPDVPIEWGVPWTGVDPYADSLAQPRILNDGKLQPLPRQPGFGNLLNRDWARSQPHDDPDRIFAD
jgi:L-alanine-DL-glutamate epimerase-like enolase superfamily enzyme